MTQAADLQILRYASVRDGLRRLTGGVLGEPVFRLSSLRGSDASRVCLASCRCSA